MISTKEAERLGRAFIADRAMGVDLTLDENPPPAYNVPRSEWHYFTCDSGAFYVGGSTYIAVHRQTGQVQNVGRLGE